MRQKDRARGLIVLDLATIREKHSHVFWMCQSGCMFPVWTHSRTNSKSSHLFITVSIDVKCHHTGCSGRVLALKRSADDKDGVEGPAE